MTRRGGARGTLAMIAGLMIASGTIRLAIGAEDALAVSAEADGTPATSMICDAQDTPAALIEALRDREARLVTREGQIADRMQAMRVAEAEITEKIAELEGAETSLAALLVVAQSAAEDDLTRLTSVYENMKSEDAAALFSRMEPAFSAGFMGRMRPEQAAAIMTELEPDVAYSISVVLAGRNATVPTE